MSNKWALITVVAAVIGALLLVLAAGQAHPLRRLQPRTRANSSVLTHGRRVHAGRGRGDPPYGDVDQWEHRAGELHSFHGCGVPPFSSGRTFYGYNPSYGMPLMVVGLEDDTSIVVTNLADGSTLDSRSALDRYETVRMYIPNRVAYKVASDKPVVAYESLFTGWSHNTFIPSIDSAP